MSAPSQISSPSSLASSPSTTSSDWRLSRALIERDSDLHPSNLYSSSPEERFQPRPSYRRHSQYYFSDGNIIFLVDGVLYNVHRYFFQRDSSNFASMLATIPHGGSGKGLTDDEPIMLPRVAANDFDLFLSILYPSDFGVHAATTVVEWTAILDLAANWNFKSIKALAIKNLTPIASPVDKIVLGRKHDIEEWLGDAYEAVCVRDEPLTLEDRMKLGMKDVIKISATRQRVRCYLPCVSNFIRETFGLELFYVQEVIPHVGQSEESNCAPEVIDVSGECQFPPGPLTEAEIKQRAEEYRKVEEKKRKAEEAEKRKVEEQQRKAEEEKRKVEEEKRKAKKRKAEEEKRKVEEKRKAEKKRKAKKRKAEEEKRKVEEEKKKVEKR